MRSKTVGNIDLVLQKTSECKKITLGQAVSDYNNWIIALTDQSHLVEL